jgi:rare lipoprotein A
MRAKRILRALRAMKPGALTLTMTVVAVVLGSVSAGALAATSGSQRSAKTPTAQVRTAHTRTAHLRLATLSSHLVVRRGQFAAPQGSTVVVHGLLKPGRRGATVKLVERAGSSWRTVAVSRTYRSGGFRIRYRVHGLGVTPIRVAFDGSRRHRSASVAAGKIVALAPTVASWYYDAGNTACGFHATYGVANKTLPCGTKVTLSYGGHTVVATVDDRGPYVYGRTFDLNQNTARYLGMWGVGQVFASV